MKGKQLALVLILLVALGGVALLLRNREAASWSESATASNEKILSFALNDVSQLTIRGEGSELNLVKKEDGWKVAERADYPADFDKVAGLIRKLWEMRPAQDVKIGPSQFARLQLTEPGKDGNSGTLIDLKANGGQRLSALLLGKKHLRESSQLPGGASVAAGRYVMPQTGSNRVFLVSETFDEAQIKPEQWLSRDFIKVEKPKTISLVGTSAEMSWKVSRETDSTPWKFLDPKPGEELDNAKASSLANFLASPSFADVLDPNAAPAETGLDKPSVATIETFDGFIYEVRIGKPMGENYPVLVSVKAELPKERASTPEEKPEDKASLDQQFQAGQKQLADKLAREQRLAGRSYLIAKATIEELLKERRALIQQPPSPTPAASLNPPAATPSPSASPARKRAR